jgi:hypothetical protein
MSSASSRSIITAASPGHVHRQWFTGRACVDLLLRFQPVIDVVTVVAATTDEDVECPPRNLVVTRR